MDALLDKAKQIVFGPFGPTDTRKATHLIGEEIIFARYREALGSYGVLVSMEHGRKNPYKVKMVRTDDFSCNTIISYHQTNWIVKVDN